MTRKQSFIPDTKMFVNCIDCRFYNKQLNVLKNAVKGKCCNPYKYKNAKRLLEYADIVWEEDTGCGYSLPKNISIDEKKYFNQNHGGWRKDI